MSSLFRLTLLGVVVSSLSATTLAFSNAICLRLCRQSSKICRPVGRGANDFYCLPKSSLPCARGVYFCQPNKRCQITTYKGQNFKICTPISWKGKVADHVKPELLIKHGYLANVGQTTAIKRTQTPARAEPQRKCGNLVCRTGKRCAFFDLERDGKRLRAHVCLRVSSANFRRRICSQIKPCKGKKTCRAITFRDTPGKSISLCVGQASAACRRIPRRKRCKRNLSIRCGNTRCKRGEKCAFFFESTQGNPVKTFVCNSYKASILTLQACPGSGICKGESKCRTTRFTGNPGRTYKLCLDSASPTASAKCRTCPRGQICRPVVSGNSIQQICRPVKCKPCFRNIHCAQGTKCARVLKEGVWTKQCVKKNTCGKSKKICEDHEVCSKGDCVKINKPCGKDGTCVLGMKCRPTELLGAKTAQCLPESIKKCPGLGYWCPRGLSCAVNRSGQSACKRVCGRKFCGADEICAGASEKGKEKCVKKQVAVQSAAKEATCSCGKPKCYLDATCRAGTCAKEQEYVCLSEMLPILTNIEWEGRIKSVTCKKTERKRKLFYVDRKVAGQVDRAKTCHSKEVTVVVPSAPTVTVQNTAGEDTCVCHQDLKQKPGWCYAWNNPKNFAVDKSCTRKRCEKSWKCSPTQVLVNGKLPDGKTPDMCAKRKVSQKVVPDGDIFGNKCIGQEIVRYIWMKIELGQ